MNDQGKGFVRAVTEDLLEQLRGLLRTQARSRSTSAPDRVSESDEQERSFRAATSLFSGTPIKTSFPYTLVRRHSHSGATTAGSTSDKTSEPQFSSKPDTHRHSRGPQWTRIWRKTNLTERDLNIPTSTGTNPTGSMTLGRGDWDMDDFRHYFREEAFGELEWTPDPRAPHREYAHPQVELIVNDRNYGTYELTIAHDTRTNTASYEQRNASSHLRWNEARSYVSNRELLGHTLEIFRSYPDSSSQPAYRLIIQP